MLDDDAVESIELLWEGHANDILDLYSHLLLDIYKVGETARMLRNSLGTVESLSQHMMAIESLADSIKEKTDHLKFLAPCLLESTDNLHDLKASPILIDDNLLA